jgi:small GTP-binding protein
LGSAEISIKEWKVYLEDLYNWIQEKYELFETDEIDEKQYNDHLEYYMKEKERIEKIIESLQNPNLTQNVPVEVNEEKEESKLALNQEAFEAYFGVKLDEGQDEEDQENTREDEAEVWEYATNQESFEDVSMKSEADQKSNDIEIRILLVGDSAVGRTSLRRSWMGKHFIDSHLTTIGASIENKVITIDGQRYNITLTDLGGQDFYSGLRRNFYRNVDGAILVFDLERPETYRRLDFWIKEMYRELKTLVPFILVGNKKESKNRQITDKQGLRASAQFSRTTLPKFRVRYMETSAKSGDNVNEIFETIVLEVMDLQYRKRELAKSK